MSMESAKRERVIQVAMKEFSKGYKQALTDRIVQEADISKGLLFHYFGSKKKLLHFLFDYGMDVMQSEFIDELDLTERDLFKLLWNITEMKMALSYRYPDLFNFLGVIYMSDEPEYKEIASKIRQMSTAAWSLDDEQVFRCIDKSLFKEGIDVQKAINMIRWTVIGLAEEILNKYPTVEDYQQGYDEMLEEIKGYMDIFKQLFYQSPGEP